MEANRPPGRCSAMPRLVALLIAAVWLGLAPPARAQLGVSVPTLPGAGNLGEVVTDATGLAERSTRETLREVRSTRVRELLRQHRRELEADPQGQPIVRSQILALGASEEALARAEAEGFQIVRRDELGEAGAMVTLRAPARMSTRRALRRLREGDPEGTYDFDHLHLESGAPLVAPALGQTGGAATGARIGLIDTGVGATRVAAARGFARDGPVAGAHGQTIAAILAATAPGAQIYAADIYGGAPTGGAASALARALAWMQSEEIPVINVSLVGPRNRIVETLTAALVAHGHLIVAAVGNDGPAAAPLFPAAYEGVIGVTGVDRNGRVLIEAGRGAHVDFAALGVHGRVRGTSYAAPIVAGVLANSARTLGATRAALQRAQTHTRDLGSTGRDDIYGFGLLDAGSSALAAR